ncbi:hypothetical protein CBS101457_004672 [Exobasidium rhododendri]|nr:hypothetical protein CBS101457_004672 [Exobasidium rhododendri]
MAGSSSKQEQGGSNLQRALSPGSPNGSDIGSVTSGLASKTGRRHLVTPNRLGNLHGAGLSSLQLALGEDGVKSGAGATSSLAGFNAISTILNNPNRPQRPIDPNSSRYPPISQSHTDLPRVKRSDYEGYITSTQKEWDRFQRNLKLGSRGKARLEAEDAEGSSGGAEGGKRVRSSPDQMEDDHIAAIGKKNLPPLSTVPQIFFAEDFDLGNPYTFDLVTERYKAAGAVNSISSGDGHALPGSGYDVALNQMLQEKLSYYSDVVEQHLILEISARSSSFFAALGNLQDLESEASQCLQQVELLKGELEDKEEGIAKAGLRVIREQAKRREMVERVEAVGILQMLCERRDLVRLLIQNGEWREGLDIMDLLQDIIEGKDKLSNGDSSLPPHVDLDLASIGAVKAIVPQLEEMKKVISAQLENDLVALLSDDLRKQIGDPEEMASIPPLIDQSSQAKVLESNLGVVILANTDGNTPASSLEKQETVLSAEATDREIELEKRIVDLLDGLIRTHGVEQAVNAYRDVALKATKATLRSYLCCSSKERGFDEERNRLATLLEDDEAASGKGDFKMDSSGIEAASRLRDMEHHQFLDMTRLALSGLMKCIRSVDVQTTVLSRVLAKAGRKEAEEETTLNVVMPLGVSPSLPSTLSTIVSDVCGLAHVLSSRLMSLRSMAHVHLPLGDFLAVFHLCWTFVLQSELICNRMIIGLRGVVLNQAKSWLANFHKIEIEKAARAVEEEMWGQAEVRYDQQKHVDLIVDSATSDPPALVMTVEGPRNVTETEEIGDEKKGDAPSSKTLEIEERQYFVVGATLDVLEQLVGYLKVVINLPFLNTETMGRVVEFSKQFNSRTCQVVLGAGAMRSAGLKNITAKHLALASQSLSIMITLIPYIRETVRRHLSPKQAVMLIEFDKLKRDYQEHQYEIHSKLVAIMSDRLIVHCRAILSIQWNAEESSKDPVKPAADLAKETTTLHKVLSKYLQPSVVANVIGQVLVSIDKRISAEFRNVQVTEEAAIVKMVAAKEHFDDKFNALKNVEWSAKELEEVIGQQKVVLEEHKLATAPPPEKKEVAPSYKARIPLFGRKSHQPPSTPTNGRASIESVDVPSADEAVPTEAPGVKEESEAILSPPSLPAKVVEAEAKDDATVERVHDQIAPPTPSKDTVDLRSDSPSHSQTDGLTASPRRSVEQGSITLTTSTLPTVSKQPEVPVTPQKSSFESSLISPPPSGGRLTLQQRLAEAARKRAQSNSSRSSILKESTVVTPSVEFEEVKKAVPAAVEPEVESKIQAETAEVGDVQDGPVTTTRKEATAEDTIIAQVEPRAEPSSSEREVAAGEERSKKSEQDTPVDAKVTVDDPRTVVTHQGKGEDGATTDLIQLEQNAGAGGEEDETKTSHGEVGKGEVGKEEEEQQQQTEEGRKEHELDNGEYAEDQKKDVEGAVAAAVEEEEEGEEEGGEKEAAEVESSATTNIVEETTGAANGTSNAGGHGKAGKGKRGKGKGKKGKKG